MYCYKFCSTVFADRQGEKLEARIDRSLAGVCSTDKLRAYKFSPPTQVTFLHRGWQIFRWKHATPSWKNIDLCYEASWKKDFVEEERPPWKTSQNSFAKRLNWVNCVTRLFPSQAHDQPMWSSFFYRAQKPAKTGRCQHSSKRGRGRSRRREARPTRGRRSPIGGSGPVAVGSQSCKKSLLYSDFLDMFALASQ